MSASRPKSASRHPLRRVAATRELQLVATQDASPESTYEGIEAQVLDFDDDSLIAGVVPVPPSITPAMREALTRACHLRFSYLDELDTWLHAPHATLRGASPFEHLVDGDGLGVLRALLSPQCSSDRRRRRGADAAAQPDLRLVR
jgi:hypothetical protein